MAANRVTVSCAVCGREALLGSGAIFCRAHDQIECDACAQVVRNPAGMVASTHGEQVAFTLEKEQ